MLKSVSVVAAVGVGWLLVACGHTVSAENFDGSSTMTFQLGKVLIPIPLTSEASPLSEIGQEVGAFIANNGALHDSWQFGPVFSVVGAEAGTGLSSPYFNLTVTAVNQYGHQTPSFGATNPVGTLGFTYPVHGGTAPLHGQMLFKTKGGAGAHLPLSVVGATTIKTAMGPQGGTLIATGAPWATGYLNITGITTNLIRITGGPRNGLTGAHIEVKPTPSEPFEYVKSSMGATLTTMSVIFTANNYLVSASYAGTLQLISPFRVEFGSRVLPGLVTQTLVFCTTAVTPEYVPCTPFPGSAAEIPSLSQVALSLVGVSLAAAAILAIQRRRHQPA